MNWRSLQQQISGRCFICELLAGNPDFRHRIVYEDEMHIAFLNKYPTLYGYVLVAPKAHRERVLSDFTDADYAAIQTVIRRVGMAIEQVVTCERLYVLSLGSQQANSHVHWHLAPLPPGIPLEAQQFHALNGTEVLDLDETEFTNLAERIAQAIGNLAPAITPDVGRVAASLRLLLGLTEPIDYEEFRYASLPLCILDAIFSINARWEGVRAAVLRYAESYGLPVTHPRGILPRREEQATVDDLIQHITSLGPERFASEIMRNRGRTSSRGGVLKASAALDIARILSGHGIQVLQDMSQHLRDAELEFDLRRVHGQSSGISVRYFFMLAGAHHLIKPDRMVISYLARILGRIVDADQAQALLSGAVEALRPEYPAITAQVLDAAIWTHERKQRRN